MNFVERKAAEHQANKRRQWEEIQARAPDLAEFLLLLAQRFGKVELKQVVFADKRPKEPGLQKKLNDNVQTS